MWQIIREELGFLVPKSKAAFLTPIIEFCVGRDLKFAMQSQGEIGAAICKRVSHFDQEYVENLLTLSA